jgi:hypothetical protein
MTMYEECAIGQYGPAVCVARVSTADIQTTVIDNARKILGDDVCLKADLDAVIVRVNYSGNGERDALILRAAHRELKAQGYSVTRIKRGMFVAIA